MDVLETLHSQGLLDDAAKAAVVEKMSGGIGLEEALLAQGLAADTVRKAFADFYGLAAYAPSDDKIITANILEYISVEAAKNYGIMPLRLEDGVLIVGANDPENFRLREVLSFVSSKYSLPYRFEFVLQSDLEKLFVAYESLTGEVDQALTSLETELDKEIAQKRANPEEEIEELTSTHMKEDAPVTKVVATILRYAVDGGASDIHVEPTDKNVRVRFRIDGILQTSLELPKNVQLAVSARIKILSSMRLDERRKPQDGRFSATFDGRKIDFRVSILPTNHGEKVVMRILDNERGINSLEDTGVSAHNLEAIRRMLNEPYGIILISGPTGSGKSTTLYAMLSEIDRATKNVMSLEDPVEYNIPGVSQSQMRPEIGYTFANGLRTALRQDPDIILVGEIRDKETAQLAIQAALTGHLVLSTIHTNNAVGVVPRLIDMGVDPYLIAPTLKLAIAQRLSRRLCPGTGREEEVTPSQQAMFDEAFATLPDKYRHRIPTSNTVRHPEASPGCASGTKGRVAVMEVLEVNDEIQQLILKNGSEEEVYNVARRHGFMSMKEDVILKALTGVVAIEEVSAYGTKVGEENIFDVELPTDEIPVDKPDIVDGASV